MSAIGWLIVASLLVVNSLIISIVIAKALKKRIKVTVDYSRGTPSCTVNMRVSQFDGLFFASILHPAELLGDKLELVSREPAKIVIKRVRCANGGSADVSGTVETIAIIARPKDMKAVRQVIRSYHRRGLIFEIHP